MKKPLPVNLNEIEQKLTEAVDFYRGMILDSLDIHYSEEPTWPQVRSMILKTFGDRGLTGKIKTICSVRN